MPRIELFLALIATLGFSSITWADIPKLINFQGILRDGSGNPVANQTKPVTLTIYTASSGGTIVWAETTSIITEANGLFNIILGADNPIPDTVFNDTARYLGITVSPDPEMTPRHQLTSAGYASRVSSVEGASGGNIYGDVQLHSHLKAGDQVGNPGALSIYDGTKLVISGTGNPGIVGNFTALGKATFGPEHVNLGKFAFVAGEACTTASDNATISGGYRNTVAGFASTVGGGQQNRAGNFSEGSATVGGGASNTASGIAATVGGGQENAAYGLRSTIAGGFQNIIAVSSENSTISGGNSNYTLGLNCTVGGGEGDSAFGTYSTVPGGRQNIATGQYSFAAGRRARAAHNGAFVWADNTDANFFSDLANQFKVRATGGMKVEKSGNSRPAIWGFNSGTGNGGRFETNNSSNDSAALWGVSNATNSIAAGVKATGNGANAGVPRAAALEINNGSIRVTGANKPAGKVPFGPNWTSFNTCMRDDGDGDHNHQFAWRTNVTLTDSLITGQSFILLTPEYSGVDSAATVHLVSQTAGEAIITVTVFGSSDCFATKTETGYVHYLIINP